MCCIGSCETIAGHCSGRGHKLWSDYPESPVLGGPVCSHCVFSFYKTMSAWTLSVRASRGGYGVGLQPRGLQAPRNGHKQLPLSWETTSKIKQRWFFYGRAFLGAKGLTIKDAGFHSSGYKIASSQLRRSRSTFGCSAVGTLRRALLHPRFGFVVWILGPETGSQHETGSEGKAEIAVDRR